MAIGNLFDNRGRRERGGEPVPSWREWSGDVSFTREDIRYLADQMESDNCPRDKKGNKEPR